MALSKPLELLGHPKARFATAWPVTATAKAKKEIEIKQWAISSQSAEKSVIGSTTILSNLTLLKAWRKRHERGVVFSCEINKYGDIMSLNKNKEIITMAEKKFFISKECLASDYSILGTLQKVAEKHNVSKKLVLNYMKRYGIERKQRRDPIKLAKAIEVLANNGSSSKEIAVTINITREYVNKIANENGIKITNNFHKGHIITHNGYRLIMVPDHPYADSKGYVREHRYVIESHIGRYLNQNEIVHHLDGDKLNNKIENLVLVDLSTHTSLHHTGKKGRGPDKRKRKQKI